MVNRIAHMEASMLEAEVGVLPVETFQVDAASSVRRALDLIVDGAIVAAVVGELGIVFVATLARWLANVSFLWTQESAALALSVIAFIGGAAAYREGQHVSVEAVVRLLPPRGRAITAGLATSIVLVVSIAVAKFAVDIARSTWSTPSPDLHLPGGLSGLILACGSALVVLYTLAELLRRRSLVDLAALVVVLALCGGVILSKPLWEAWSLSLGLQWQNYLWIGVVLMAILLAIGVPIAFVLLAIPIAYFFVSRQVPTIVVGQQMTDSTTSFLLLAIPFFVLAGVIMAHGGLGRRLVDLVTLFIGRLPGGLQQSVIGFMYLFSGLSGSKVADMAAVGTTLGPELERAGYQREQTAAVLAASSVMGETIPPSIALLVLGAATSLSVGGLFVAGIIPAAFLALLCAVIVAFTNRRVAPRGPSITWHQRARIILRGLPALGLPVILIYGVAGGVGTPTEVSSFAVVYGVIVAAFYREMRPGRLWQSCRETAFLSGMIIFIIASATAFSWFLNIEQLPTTLTGVLNDMGDRRWAFVLASIALLVLMGAFLEGLPALIIFSPILLPMAVAVGVNPIQYGIVLIAAMGLGFYTPPIGIGAYVACSIAKTKVEKLFKPLLPYWIVLLLGIIVLGFVEWPSTVLPRLFHLGQ